MIKKEIRLRSGKLDEIVGEGYYHLEQMSPEHWWMCLGDVHVNLYVENGEIKANWEDEGEEKVKVVEQDEIG